MPAAAASLRLGVSYSSNPVSLDGLSSVFNWDGGFTPGPRNVADHRSVAGQWPGRAHPYQEDGLPGRIMNWNFNVSVKPSGLLADVAYTGMYSVHLNTLTPFNQVNPSQLKLGDLLPLNITDPRVTAAGYTRRSLPLPARWRRRSVPIPSTLNVTHTYLGNGSSTYNALQAKLERRFKSLAVLVSYTWEKALTRVGPETQTGSGIAVQDQYNHKPRRACSASISAHPERDHTWDLPFARHGNRLMRMVAGG